MHLLQRAFASALLGLLVLGARPALAQDVRDGETLPAKAGGLIVNPAFSTGTTRFGPGWRFFKRESILADFANLDLTHVIAGDRAGDLEKLFGSFGTTKFEATQSSVGLQFTLAYGITDRLTVAAIVPFSFVSYELDAWLVPKPMNQSHYRVKDPKAINCPTGDLQISDPSDLGKILQEEVPSYQFNVGDLRSALISNCLGYKDPMDKTFTGQDSFTHGIGHRSYNGIRDIILGAKYQWFHGERIHLSSLVYVVTPTGHPDDPDDLFDPAFGDGQWDAALLIGLTVPLGKFRIAASAGYEIQFGDQLVRRLSGLTFNDELEAKLARGEISEQQLYADHLDDGSITPIVTAYDKALVQRKLGDNIYLYTGGSYQLLEWLSVGVTLDFIHHFRDAITDTGTHIADGTRYKTSDEIRAEVDALIAGQNFATDAERKAAKETELRNRLPESASRKAAAYAWHTVRDTVTFGVGIGVNTLGMFGRDEFPLPLIASIGAAIPIGGQNIDALDSFNATLVIPFVFGDVKDPEEYGYDDEPNQGLPWP